MNQFCSEASETHPWYAITLPSVGFASFLVGKIINKLSFRDLFYNVGRTPQGIIFFRLFPEADVLLWNWTKE